MGMKTPWRDCKACGIRGDWEWIGTHYKRGRGYYRDAQCMQCYAVAPFRIEMDAPKKGELWEDWQCECGAWNQHEKREEPVCWKCKTKYIWAEPLESEQNPPVVVIDDGEAWLEEMWEL